MKRIVLVIVVLMSLSLSGMAQRKTLKASDYVKSFTSFVDSVSVADTLSATDKAKIEATYKTFIADYKVVKDSLSDAQVRECSKAKVLYQKTMARVFINNTSDDVSTTATKIGKKASSIFKKTKSKVKGAIDALKE